MTPRPLRYLASLLAVLATACSASSESDESSTSDELSSDSIPTAIGFIVRDLGQGAALSCVATLVDHDVVVSGFPCTTTDFLGIPGVTGGAHADVFFTRPKDFLDKSKWIGLKKIRFHEYTTIIELEKSVPGATPVRLPNGPLTAADVGDAFVTFRVEGNGAGGPSPQLLRDQTTLKAITGPGMHAVYPTFADFVTAMEHPASASSTIASGVNDPNNWLAGWYQQPLLDPYEVLTFGSNEPKITVRSMLDSKGAPLLRKVGNQYEFVGLYKEGMQRQDEPKTTLASYYVAFPANTLAAFRGGTASGRHCAGLKAEQGICKDGFTLNCPDRSYGPPFLTLMQSRNYCGTPNRCKLHSHPTLGSSASCQ